MRVSTLDEFRTALTTELASYAGRITGAVADKRISALKGLLPDNLSWVAGSALSLANDVIARNVIPESLIILDDVERVADSSLRESLFEYLIDAKENLRCKVIVITDENKLSLDRRAAVLDKLIDATVEISQSINDVKLASGEELPKNFVLGVSAAFSAASITNIRTMFRSYDIVRDIESILGAEYSSVELLQSVSELVGIVSVARYHGGVDGIPSLEFLREVSAGKHDILDLRGRTNEVEATENSQRFHQEKRVCQEWQFYGHGNLSSEIESLVVSGSCDVERLRAGVEEAEQSVLEAHIRIASKKAWSSYHDVTATADEVASQLSGYFRRYKDRLGLTDVDQIVRALDECGDQGLVREVAEEFVASANQSSIERLNTRSTERGVGNPVLREAVMSAYGVHRKASLPTLLDALLAISGHSRSAEVTDVACSESIESYVDALKSYDGALVDIVRPIMRINTDNDPPLNTIKNKLDKACDQLAGESEFNRRRIDSWRGS